MKYLLWVGAQVTVMLDPMVLSICLNLGHVVENIK